MRQKIIKRILALSMVGAMAFALSSCVNTSSQDEPSESQSTTQEIEPTPTPNEDEPTKATQGQEAEQSSATPTQEPTPTPSEDTPTNEPQEPITTQEPTPSQEPIQTQTPTTTTTPTPTTPPTSTPIHTHSFIGGDCSTPSTCDCGEIGGYGNHNWTYRHIDEVGHYESNGTHQVLVKKCNCGFIVRYDQPDATTIWEDHYFDCGGRYVYWYEDVPNEDSQYVVDIQAHDETYCTICGAIQ